MPFVVSTLANYTNPNENVLITKAMFEAKTASRMTPLTGVKSTIEVPTLSDALFWQDGSTCGFSASGNTSISGRTLTIGKIKVNKEWCIKDLEAKYTQLLLAPGSNYTALPGGIDQAFVNTVTGTNAEQIEIAIWQGDLASGNPNINKFDGLVKIINAASGTVNANTTAFVSAVATAITEANIISIMQGVYKAIPISLLDKTDLRVNVGTHIFRLYQIALTNANLFNYTAVDNALGEMFIHGTNVKVISCPGLNNVNAIYALQDANMFLGVDLQGEEETFKFWYSEDFDLVRFKMEFKYGVQVSQVAEIVKFTI
jgi:hypothetical protein